MVNLQWGYLTNVLCASVCCLKPSCTCERQRLIACPESLKATPIDRWEVISCQSVALLAGHSVAGVLGLQKLSLFPPGQGNGLLVFLHTPAKSQTNAESLILCNCQWLSPVLHYLSEHAGAPFCLSAVSRCHWGLYAEPM